MRRRTILAGVAMAATAGTAVALTLPALADTDANPGRSTAASQAAVDRVDELLAAMQRDLRLDGDQARERLRRERWASGVTADLRAETGAAYAGAWVNAERGTLTVAVTDPELADEVRATGAQAEVVRRSEDQLDRAKRQLDDATLRAGRQVPGWYVDPSSNSVVVMARPGAEDEVRDWVESTGAPDGAVRVVTSDQQPRPLFDVRAGDPFGIGQGRCSVGFSVVGGFVTAGHCGREGADTTGFNGAAQGTFVASSFPGDDYGVVEVNDDWDPRPVVNTERGELPVAGAQEAPVGAAVCRTGSTTGTRCGEIEAKNVTVNYPEGRVGGLTQTNVCAEPGDSGGSWLSGDQAQGVTSGGSGDCTVGGTTFFQPVGEILAAENRTLVTTGDAQPPAGDPTDPPAEQPSDPPADEPDAPTPTCDNPSTVRSGSISGSGRGQVQPRGGAFRAAAGTHTACLDGPDDANFDVVLQRATSQGWQTVARTDAAGADERMTFTGSSGTYRYIVASLRGAGTYDLAITAP